MFFVFFTDKKFLESKTNSTPLKPSNSLIKGFTILSISFASHFFLFLVDSPYKKAIGVSGTKHMSAFIEHFSTGDGRRLTKAIREICQTIETKNNWTSIRKEGKTIAF